MTGTSRHVRIGVRGLVQGVGFRPFVYDLAVRLGLSGYVLNDSDGVKVEIEGPGDAVDRFRESLEFSAPPLAKIEHLVCEECGPAGMRGFEIRMSRGGGIRQVLVSADIATCADCERELFDPSDRRYGYPFINCTNCGPRYTIIEDVPYDRCNTTMAEFEMCEACRHEYDDPGDRRFHAQPVCCPECGPEVWLTDPSGRRTECDLPISRCGELLTRGKILAVKGLGGFHLVCDASDDTAVRTLRKRKAREEKPLAVMVRDLERARELSVLTPLQEKILCGREKPVLIVPGREGSSLSKFVAPGAPDVGIMLPYTPLHMLLLRETDCPALVMTSGNITDEPIAYTNSDALEHLSGIADFFLLHNRKIHIRTDDSVGFVSGARLRFLRRSRGYAPFPVKLDFAEKTEPVLAVGAELKNTVCLTRSGYAFLSHHIGDLKNAAAHRAFRQGCEHLSDILRTSPAAVACDKHPLYICTRYAQECGLPVVYVQHHHAHIASVLAEEGIFEKVIGVCFDGLGWGEDDRVWGGEFLICDLADSERLGHFEYVPMPGGDAAVRNPSRMAYVYLRSAFCEDWRERASGMLRVLDGDQMDVLDTMVDGAVNCPLTSSAGRLFDAAASLLGLCHVNTYEAQAPRVLEATCARNETGAYDAPVREKPGGGFTFRGSDIIKSLVEDRDSGATVEVCSARFHNSIVQCITRGCEKLRECSAISTVALSGGVFANRYLLERACSSLEQLGFNVITNSEVPAGDGGISLGQAAVAAWRSSCASQSRQK